MNEHLSQQKVEDYRLGRLGPEELLKADDHLSQCEACRRSAGARVTPSATRLYTDLGGGLRGDHLTFDQTAAYVEGRLTGEERQTLEDHLVSCAQCSPLVEDLRVFRNQIAPELDREFRPSDSPGEARVPSSAIKTRLFTLPGWVYAAATAALLVSIAAWVAWKSSTINLSREIAAVSPTVAPSPSIEVPLPSPSVTEAAGSVIVRIQDGGLFLTLDSLGNLDGAESWPEEYKRMVREALRNQRVTISSAPASQLAGLNRRGSSLMGADDHGQTFAAIEPVGKIILADSPTFRWSRLAGVEGYVIEVYDERFNVVAKSPLVIANNWTAPSLKRGQVFSWQVKAIKGGNEFLSPRPPAPQARFRILDQATATEISRATREYSSSQLLLGLLYAKAGLLDEAEKKLSTLEKSNPDTAVVRSLVESIRASEK